MTRPAALCCGSPTSRCPATRHTAGPVGPRAAVFAVLTRARAQAASVREAPVLASVEPVALEAEVAEVVAVLAVPGADLVVLVEAAAAAAVLPAPRKMEVVAGVSALD